MTTQTISGAVEKRDAGPVTIMWSKRAHFRAVLPASVDVEAFLGTAAGALYADPRLMAAAQANPDSLITAMMRCAALGHLPGTDEFYLLWRNIYDKQAKVKRPTVQGLEGYRGIIERMYRSGAVAKVVVREVCAKDKFRFVEGQDDRPVHATGGADPYNSNSTGADFFGENGSRDRGEMVGVYAYAELTSGATSRVVLLTRDDVMAAREASDAKDSDFSPWNRLDGGKDHPEFTGRSMWWKTAARRLEPWVPTSAEYRATMLRASATAAELAGTRSVPPELPAAAPADIHDAEIVDDPPAPAADRRPLANGQPATAKALDKLNGLLDSLPLGPPEQAADDRMAILGWLGGGPWEGTRSQVTNATSVIESFIEAAGGDLGEAVTAIWARYNDGAPVPE